MSNVKRIKFEAGTTLIHENDISRKLFILKKGRVRVFKKYMGGKITLATLGPGEIFGELSFFDSKPRSASVESITEVETECIDGAILDEDIASLPKWVHLVFRSVASRFRDIDQKMAILQSLNSFQRKTLSNDAVGSTIYSELLRMMKILKMILNDKGNSQTKEFYTKELVDTLGESYISYKNFLRVLFEYDFIDHDIYENQKVYCFKEENLDEFENFLKKSFKSDSCVVLTNYALNLMRTIISFLDLSENVDNEMLRLPQKSIEISPEDKELNFAYNQLKKRKIIYPKTEGTFIRPKEFFAYFKFFSIIKSFDHTIIYE